MNQILILTAIEVFLKLGLPSHAEIIRESLIITKYQES